MKKFKRINKKTVGLTSMFLLPVVAVTVIVVHVFVLNRTCTVDNSQKYCNENSYLGLRESEAFEQALKVGLKPIIIQEDGRFYGLEITKSSDGFDSTHINFAVENNIVVRANRG